MSYQKCLLKIPKKNYLKFYLKKPQDLHSRIYYNYFQKLKN